MDSIDELFSRDPEGYSKGPSGTPRDGDDIRRIVEGLRRQREIWQKAEAAGAKRAPAPVKAGKPGTASLADLGLDE